LLNTRGRSVPNVEVITWPQETNAVSRATSARLKSIAHVHGRELRDRRLSARAIRRGRRRITWVPAGGSVSLGALGHVNAALELVAQAADVMALPDTTHDRRAARQRRHWSPASWSVGICRGEHERRRVCAWCRVP
jgi:hypothetical protein